MSREIRVAHSPDSDDAFMFYGLASGKVATGNLRYTHILDDIETLNRKALEGEYEVSAVSFHAYAYLSGRYALLPVGGSLGEDYGPVLVARDRVRVDQLAGARIAVPGILTTAFLVLRLFDPGVRYQVVAFDRILDAVRHNEVEAGLLIHEGQLTYGDSGLQRVLDLGQWWRERTGLPLPLGGNVIRRDLEADVVRQVCGHIRESIRYGLEHRDEAVTYAAQFARGLSPDRVDRFIEMYANERSLDYGPAGRAAIGRLFEEAHAAGLVPERLAVRFAGDNG